MSEKSSYQELEQQIIRLERQVARVRRAEKVNKTLFHIATALNTSKTLKDLYGAIHTHLSSLMDMTNFFIAVYYKDKNAIQYVFRRDQEKEVAPKWIQNFKDNPSLTGDVILTKRPVLLDEDDLINQARQGRVHGSLPKNWLGVPLMIQDDVLGVMAVKSYTNPIQYTQEHVELLSFVSETIAVAIEKKRAENELLQARKRLIRSQKLEAIGTLAAGIAHDFNNTLSITLGNINLAQMIAASDPVKEYLARCRAVHPPGQGAGLKICDLSPRVGGSGSNLTYRYPRFSGREPGAFERRTGPGLYPEGHRPSPGDGGGQGPASGGL